MVTGMERKRGTEKGRGYVEASPGLPWGAGGRAWADRAERLVHARVPAIILLPTALTGTSSESP